jgi:hypothetical protein
VLLGITCCGDLAITICALKKLLAFENYSVEAVTIFGSCKTATRECLLRGCSRSLDGEVVSSHPRKSRILNLMFLYIPLINKLN